MAARKKVSSVEKVAADIFPRLGLTVETRGTFDGRWLGSGATIEKRSPIDGSVLARVTGASASDVERTVNYSQDLPLAQGIEFGAG
jgi:hypothetical protein